MDIKQLTKIAVAELGIALNDAQLTQLEKYYLLLVQWNEKMNLTAITDPESVAIKHFADSLAVFKYIDIPQGSKIIDVGTGAGFPGVVMKIVRPDIQLTLLDSLKKRLTFLETVLNETELQANCIHSRAEDGGQNIDLRESFDFTVSRAVARLNVLSEYCLPYVRLSGSFIAFKGPDAISELDSAKKAIGILGGKVKKIQQFSLPQNGGERTLIITEKIKPTPDKYPRNSGKIKTFPL